MSKGTITQTAQQKLNNFLRSDLSKTYPLNGYIKATLHALASYFYYSDKCWPSLSKIYEYSSFSKRETIRSLEILEALGLILIERRNGANNIYTWAIPDTSEKQIYKAKAVGKSKTNIKPVPGRHR